MHSEEQRAKWRAANKKYREAHPDRVRKQRKNQQYKRSTNEVYRQQAQERTKRWRKDNPNRYIEQQHKNVLACYGLTIDDYEEILRFQGGVCAICGHPAKGKKLVVDHDHKCCATARTCGRCTRGLVHSSCNVALGNFGDDITVLKKAIEYVTTGGFMSKYSEIKTQLKDKECIIDALKEKGFKPQSHENAVALTGYEGDRRSDKAEIIIPRSQVGHASNDIGFKRQDDGTYKAIISQYDGGRYNQKWLDEISQSYAEKKTSKIARNKGLTLSKKHILPNGNIKLIYVKA
jgi:hypothetical protein